MSPKIKKINIITFANLEQDILYLFSSIGNIFGEYDGLMECLREIR